MPFLVSIPMAASVSSLKVPVVEVVEEAIGAEIASDVEVVPAVVVRVRVTEAEGPTALFETALARDTPEGAVPVIAVEDAAAAVIGGLEAFRKRPRSVGLEEVDRLEIC